jgi:hypothetical protein
MTPREVVTALREIAECEGNARFVNHDGLDEYDIAILEQAADMIERLARELEDKEDIALVQRRMKNPSDTISAEDAFKEFEEN